LFAQNPDGVYSLDRKGKFVAVNPAMEGLTGYASEELIGKNSARLIAPEDRRRAAGYFCEALRGEPRNYEMTAIRKDGRRIELGMTQVPILIGGEVVGVYGIAKDITERKQAEEALKESERRFSTLLFNAPVYFYRCLNEPGWPNEFVSDYAPELTGYTAEELSDGSVMFGDLIVEEDRQRVWEEAQRALAGRRRFDLRYAIRRRDGELRHMEDNGQGVYDEEGHLEALEGIVYDVTEHERAEEKLRQAEERYRSLVETSPAITNIEDCDTNATLYDSPQIEEVLGHPADSYVTDPMYWEKIVHPDDRERVRTEELRSVQRGRFGMEYRCTAKDGRVVWLRDEATIVRDAEGNPRCWQGVLLDITELKRVEEALREAEARYRMLVVQVPAVTYIDGADETNTVIYRSPQIEAVLGYTPEELSSGFLSWQDLLHPDDRERVLEENERTNRTGEPFSIEYRMIATDGRVVWIRDEATLVRGDDGEPLYWQGVFTDITERKALEERLEHQALHDPLTGLPNRTLFMDRLGQALARSGRRNKSVAVLFLDLDDFKVINDSLGHEAGDELLVAVAARLRGGIRTGDTVARFGGDEFAVLLEKVGRAREAVGAAERIAEVLRAPFVVDGHELFAAPSIGIALGDSGADRPEDLLRNADLAM
jgi:diguanylate cyclase (GGDEF)-like protein/PAS domain S-box-containing protein